MFPKPGVARSIRAGGILKRPKFAEFRGFGLSYLPENFQKAQNLARENVRIAPSNILFWENVNLETH
jgi:hypothetical protein